MDDVRIAFEEKYARCPFFKSSLKKGVTCEGIAPRTSTVVTFVYQEDKKKFFHERCCEDFERCPMYKSLLREKYNED